VETTINYGLKKPAGSDYYNIEDFNYNADAIDTALEDKMDKAGGAFSGDIKIEKNMPVIFLKNASAEQYYYFAASTNAGSEILDIGANIGGTGTVMMRFSENGEVSHIKSPNIFRNSLGIVHGLVTMETAGIETVTKTITFPGKTVDYAVASARSYPSGAVATLWSMSGDTITLAMSTYKGAASISIDYIAFVH
jgi:hypothetical protein